MQKAGSEVSRLSAFIQTLPRQGKALHGGE